MSRVVHDHYPASKLPADLRGQIGDLQKVRVTVEPVPISSTDSQPITRLLEEMQDCRVFSGDPVKRIRALRAEWEWREELQDRIRADGST